MSNGAFEPTLHLRRVRRNVNGQVVEVIQQLWVNTTPVYIYGGMFNSEYVPEEWRDVPLEVGA